MFSYRMTSVHFGHMIIVQSSSATIPSSWAQIGLIGDNIGYFIKKKELCSSASNIIDADWGHFDGTTA